MEDNYRMVAEEIYVDGEIFLNRLDEQNRFRQALEAILNTNSPDTVPYVFLLKGDSGVGKSKLLRRLRDIAATESPFDTEIQTILADWELERYRSTSLKVPPDVIQANTVFYHLYRMARDAGWGHHFSDYQNAIRFLNEVETKVGDQLEQAVWGDRYGVLRFLEVDGVQALISDRLGPSDKGLLPLPKFVADLMADGHATLRVARTQVDDWLARKAGLDPQEEEIFRRPKETLAGALGSGFARVSRTKPLVILLDGYEVISRVDPWLRIVIEAAGPRVVWVIAGDNGLANQDEGPVTSESEDKPSLFQVVLNLQDFNQALVAEYLHNRAPDRLLTRADAQAFYQTTLGFPLALQIAADLWAGGVPLEEIVDAVSDSPTREEVLASMSQRFLANCDDPDDRRALMMVAIQRRPDETVQSAILRPEKGAFDYYRRISRLKVRYLSIRQNGAVNVHSSLSESIKSYLLRHRIRVSEEVKAITTRATTVIRQVREQLESGFPRLEDRFESEEWREVMLDSVHWMFWHNEFNAWRQLNRDFVDALGYDRDLVVSLVRLVDQLEPLMSRDSRQRWRVISAGCAALVPVATEFHPRNEHLNAIGAMIAELDRWFTRYGAKDYFASERRAILDLRLGELYFWRGKYNEALNLYQQVEKNIPARGEALPAQLGQALEEVGEKIAWRREGLAIIEALPSAESEMALKKALTFGRRRASTYHALGAVQIKMGRWQAALENILQAVTLNPANKSAWETLGDVYFEHKQYEKAIPAYRRAAELDPSLIKAQLSLAFCLRQLQRTEDYQEHISQLRGLVDGENEYLRACFEAVLGNTDPALAFLKIALKQGQVSLDKVREDPFFETLHNNKAFQNLIST